MSTIDLESLIVRQTYSIPIKSSDLKEAVLKELEAHLGKIRHVSGWIVLEEHTHGFWFQYNYEHRYIMSQLYKSIEPPTSEQVQEQARKYSQGGMETYLAMIADLMGSAPVDLHVFVLEEKENSCLCEVECSPNLYKQIFQLGKKDVEKVEIQDARVHCKRFVKYIFKSGLGGTLFNDEKLSLLQPAVQQLLVNDQSSHQILKKIETMLGHATGEVLLCGWIGTLLLPKLKEMKQKGVKIRVVTHKAKELKGQRGHQDAQRAFKELISTIGEDNISIRPECHCRVVVVDNKALIGSMDINATSLTGSHRELAIYTEDPEIVRNLRKYFNGIFSPLSKEKAK